MQRKDEPKTDTGSTVRIGVDSLFPAKGRWWCHLVCDDFRPSGLLELHAFARTIGAPEQAFHDPSGHPRPHYDLWPELRERALAFGAESLDRRGLIGFLTRGRSRLSAESETSG